MKAFVIVVFCLYLVILAKLVLFKGSFFFQVVPTSTEYIRESRLKTLDTYNLVPFRSIHNYITGNVSKRQFFFNIIGNVLLFVPFGLLLPSIFKKAKQWKTIVLTSVLLSFFFEVYQFITHSGQFDIDDIILNTTGGITGYFLYSLFRTAAARHYKAKVA